MLRALCVLGGVALYLVVALGLTGASTGSHSYATSKYALELDGVQVGMLKSCEGGDCYADVITERSGAGGARHKHIGPAKYAPITMELTPGMTQVVHKWIADAVAGRAGRKNGAIVVMDYAGKVQKTREFTNALIQEVIFPACDASSKDASYITLTIQPELVPTCIIS